MPTEERSKAYRKLVSGLIGAVLDDTITSRTALNCWPAYANEDLSTHCAYTMMWFFESDEDRHFEEAYYSDVQLYTLQEAFKHLKDGQALPVWILQKYQTLMLAPPDHHNNWFLKSPFLRLKKWVGKLKNMIECHPLLSK